ncbi:multicopper oxidase family protein [Actinocrispum sp. NPDC049592]|uniref:multicopper oxidase family protein n=1 Tax=Actinocrispum sp. NPDC049592 TaxID=3154835 RepID=UPI003425A051
MRVSRRRFLGIAGGTVALGAAIPYLAQSAETGTEVASQTPLPTPFTRPLPVPPVLKPGSHPDFPDADYYEVTESVARQEILPGRSTEIWGYNGIFPGPTIVSRSGRRTVIKRTNALPAPTVTHLHGGQTPPESDGFPTDLVSPSSSRIYEYPLRQRPATLWYHDHTMGSTAPNNYRGLMGFHLIEDDENLPVPRGDRDIPLMITDRSFAADGELLYPGMSHDSMAGVLGDVILVNGAPWPVLSVAAARYRFRLLNASNARRYDLALDPVSPLVQIGSDGGLLAEPLSHDNIEVAPAERFDVVVDFSHYQPGQEVTLVNRLGEGPTAQVMRLRVGQPLTDTTSIPARLSTIDSLGPATVTRDFLFRYHDVWTINDKEFDPDTPLASPRLGDTEIWRFVSDFHHSIHIHLAQFQVLSRNGEEPGPYDAGWKDTVDLRPTELVSVIARFTGYRGRYVMHCHNLEHEDMMMMGTIQVV